jgi:hypothetical protein
MVCSAPYEAGDRAWAPLPNGTLEVIPWFS